METNDFDRSGFNELLGYMERFRQIVEKVEDKTDTFCNSFNSGIEKVRRGLEKIGLDGLAGSMDKLQGSVGRLNAGVMKTGTNLREVWVANAEAAVNGLASASEMTYSILSTVASLNKLGGIKISTDAEKNRQTLEGIVGSGERMQRLFDELQANPLLKNLGLEKDVFARPRARWEVLRQGKEDAVGLMNTYGEGREEAGQFAEGWKKIRNDKNHTLRGFGSAVKAVFQKKESLPGEEGQRKGFFSIFRKKGEEDKNWFTAVAARFTDFKDRTADSLAERFTPLMQYGTRIATSYSPLYGMAENAMNLMRLGGDFQANTRLAGLKMANGWGIGNREEQQMSMDKITRNRDEWSRKMLEKPEKAGYWQQRINGVVEQMGRFTGTTDQLPSFQESTSAPAMIPAMASLTGGGGVPVAVNVGRLVENLYITPADLREGMEEVRNTVINELSRIVNNANNLVVS